MTTLSVRARGLLPAEQAWERYARPKAWPGWAPQIRHVECAATRIAPGVTGRVIAIGGLAVSFEVDAVDEDARVWSWHARLGPVTLRLEHGVVADGDGSSTWLRVTGPLPIVVGYLPVAALALRRLLRP